MYSSNLLTRLDLYARIHYLSITNVQLAFVNAIGESRLRSCTFVYTLFFFIIFNTITMLTVTAWSSGEPALLAIRKSRFRASTDFFKFSIIILVKSNRPWAEWQGKVKH